MYLHENYQSVPFLIGELVLPLVSEQGGVLVSYYLVSDCWQYLEMATAVWNSHCFGVAAKILTWAILKDKISSYVIIMTIATSLRI